jgi:hypothetical protein
MWLNWQVFRWAVWLIPSRLVLADDNWLLWCCVLRYHKGLTLCNGNIAIFLYCYSAILLYCYFVLFIVSLHALRLPPWCKGGLRSSGMLRSVNWYFIAAFQNNLSASSSGVSYYQSVLYNIPEDWRYHFFVIIYCFLLYYVLSWWWIQWDQV